VILPSGTGSALGRGLGLGCKVQTSKEQPVGLLPNMFAGVLKTVALPKVQKND
jgi:hypothetical protein